MAMDRDSAIDSALAALVSEYVTKRPKTAAMQARAAKVMPGGNTRTVLFSQPFPIRVERAEGSLLTDIDGHSYIDFVGEYSAGIYGHSHPVIAAAVAEAMQDGLNIGAQHTREVAFAEAVAARFSLERLRFTNSGTEANMMALAAARAFTGRPAIMPMNGGYHGGTLYFSHGASPVNAPFECVLGEFNDVAATQALIDRQAGKLAAVILEPMQGGGGCIPASLPFLHMLRQRCEAHGIVLIFDEVMTSRLHPGGLAMATGVTPDLKTLGKYIGGGMSFGAFGGRADIMDQFDPSRPNALPHAGTFNNNTLTMAAGFVGLTQIFTPEVCVAHNARGEALRVRLNDLFMGYQAALQVTGIGSLLTLHPVGNQISSAADAQKADPRLRRLLYFHLLGDGIYVAERGFMALALTLSDDDLTALMESLRRFTEKYRHLLK
jgi:glutamate-1-semialdehyde 2,1-aminomutase